MVPDNAINATLNNLELLLKLTPSLQTAEILERFRLDFVLKCLHSDSLQKRVKAVNDMNGLIKKALRKKNYYAVNSGEANNTWIEPA